MAFNGLVKPSIVLSVMRVRAAAAVLSWKDRKLKSAVDEEKKETTFSKHVAFPFSVRTLPLLVANSKHSNLCSVIVLPRMLI